MRFPFILLLAHDAAAAVFWEALAYDGSTDPADGAQVVQPPPPRSYELMSSDRPAANAAKEEGRTQDEAEEAEEEESLVGQAEIRFRMGDIDFRAEPDALLQIVERIGTIKKGMALYRTTNELSTTFTSNLLLTSVVGYSGTQYLVRALSAAKHDVRISIAGVDGAIRLLIHNHETYRDELASFGRLLPLWQAIEFGYMCEPSSPHAELRDSAKGTIEHIASLVDEKLRQVNSTSTIRLERDISKMLKAMRRPAEIVAQHLQISLP